MPPGAPAVAATPGTDDSLDVAWAAPANAGKPAIATYDLHYRPGSSGNWIDGPQDVAVTSAAIPDLSPRTSYQVEVRATNAEGDSDWSSPGTGSTNDPLNSAPTFANPTVTLTLPENTAGGVDIGSPVEAVDADAGDTLTYSLTGADATSFTIVTSSGQIRTRSGVTYDFEAPKNTYSLSVTVTDQTANASASVTINLSDVAEPPAKPAAPAVAATPGAADSLDVSWTAPPNAGKPAITSYDLRYRKGDMGGWTERASGGTASSATIDGLDGNSSYQVEVLARNDEGASPWSDHGTGRTGNSAPVFDPPSVTLSVPENTPASRSVGSPVQATDSDSDTLEYALVGSDGEAFDIDSASGQIRTMDPLNHETKPSYSFRVRAEDGNGGTAFADVRVDVSDVNEPPATPLPPTVTATAGSNTSLTVSWTVPATTGPPVGSYDLQYRLGRSGDWTDGQQNVSGTSTTVSDLLEGQLYEVRVRASNGEGESGWSQPGEGRTNTEGNQAPAFARSSEARALPENSPAGTPVGDPVAAEDPDPGDELEYSLEGADAASFDIDSGSGQIRARSGVSYDYEATNRYEVTVRAADAYGGSDSIPVSIRVTDEDEPPEAPGRPAVAPVPGSATSLAATWEAPYSPDRPPVTGYDLQYRKSGEALWRNGPRNLPAARGEITGLEAGVDYDVQALARNAEGASGWSPIGSGRTHALAARVVQAPARHAGSGRSFTVRIEFSEAITLDDEAVFRDHAATAAGGSLTEARRVAGNLWELTLEPDSSRAVVVSLSRSGSCGGLGALCTSGGAPLSHDLDHAVPGPETEVVTIRAVAPAVTEGEPAVFELQRAGPVPDRALTVTLELVREGDLFVGQPPATATFQPGEATVRLQVATDDDSVSEPGGYLLYRLEGDGLQVPDYVRGAAREAAVQVRDNDGGSPPPRPPLARQQRVATAPGGTASRPVPLQLALWTDRPAYLTGETMQLRYTLNPHDDRGEHRVFFYLEQVGGEQRRFLAPLAKPPGLRAQAVDQRGRPAATATTSRLRAAEKVLAWEGAAPEPGLWQFVMDLRPEHTGAPGEDAPADFGVRRAWAKFTVATRGQLLIRRGLDREVSADLTLRSDTLHYLMGQLFVTAGATLTIEPGTVVQAWGLNAAVIVERGGKIVAKGTRQAPVVLTCSRPPGQRYPGCWGGLRILGRAPVTRLEGVAGGVRAPERPVYGGTDPRDSSGTLRYVRVEFAGAGTQPGTVLPAVGFYGVGDGTAIDHLQARAGLGHGIAFSGGTAGCDHCVASGSVEAGLAWERGWRGAASHLYVHHGEDGLHGVDGINDPQGYNLEPRSLPTLSNVTLVHAVPYSRRARDAVGLRLHIGSGVQARDLLATGFGEGAIDASGRSTLMFHEGESWVSGALLHRNGNVPGNGQLRGGVRPGVQFIDRKPDLRDVRYFANPDPRPESDSPAMLEYSPAEPPPAPAGDSTGPDGGPPKEAAYIGAFGDEENWLEEWTVFGSDSDYDPRNTDGTEP